jgi:transitional endoplasmic reticulum ATPase
MSLSFDTFERYKQRGLDARRAGQWDSARVYLLEAARTMLELSKQASTDSLKDARRATAEKFLNLARDCEEAKQANRRPPAGDRASGESGKPRDRAQREQTGDEKSTDAADWMVKEKPTIKFDDVAGLEDVKTDIKLKMLYPFTHAELAERFGIRAGGGVLLYGPPGTGKTMLAKATAGEIEAAFFVISPADILSKWVGEAEQNIKKLFDAASQEPRSIIFIDEIEALVPARRDEGTSVMQRLVPQILQSVEGFAKSKTSAVMLMGATNVPWQLDPAILRPGRFDEKVYIPLPDHAARKKMLEIYLGKRPLADDVDFDRIATRLNGYSGADIRYIADRAAIIPFMKAVAGEGEQPIDLRIIESVISEAAPSVSPEAVKRFEDWMAAGERA